MQIVIVGGGETGAELALRLTAKRQSVVLIEKDPQRATELQEQTGVLVINGDGANAQTLEKAKIRSAGLLIAVTDINEVNIIACMVGKNKQVPRTVARIRTLEDPANTESRGLSLEQMGIDVVINPDRAVAHEILKMILFPDAEEVEYFAGNRVVMVRVPVSADSEIANQTLKALRLEKGSIVMGIKRANGDFVIPGGNDRVQAGDRVYVIGSVGVIRGAQWLLPKEATQIRRVLILGGGVIGRYLASLVESNREQPFRTKIIEKDPEASEALNRALSKTIVLPGDASDRSYFNAEEFADADAVVAVTGDDRTNIVASVMAEKMGAKKIIAKVNDMAYAPVYSASAVDSAVNPHLITASQILRLTRSEDLVSLSLLKNEDAEAMELVLPPSAKVVGKKLADAGLPKGVLIGMIVRDGETTIPHGDTVLQAGDHLIVFALPKLSSRLDRVFGTAS